MSTSVLFLFLFFKLCHCVFYLLVLHILPFLGEVLFFVVVRWVPSGFFGSATSCGLPVPVAWNFPNSAGCWKLNLALEHTGYMFYYSVMSPVVGILRHSLTVAQVGLVLAIIVPFESNCCDYRHGLSCSAFFQVTDCDVICILLVL